MKLEYIEPKNLHRRLLEAARESGDRLLKQTAPDEYSDSDSDQFDTNMVIILAVLLCAALLALALYTFARCGLHYRFRSSSSPEQQAQAPQGLNKRALRQLPVAVYGSEPGNGISSKECPICLGEFVNGERIRVLLKCSHGFHVGCIDTWLISHASCPNCRVSLLEPRPSTGPHHHLSLNISNQ
ncbi:hypothetical protein CDL12_00905 [Handroanthus impetiginosus]|uniref:RING-type E3 ubiquitin transferase n=1 Tax=Handroanthus impetiginosus TaxID=429701 RepID=A0A2G9I991_9LAMI|nr:hypothetical protein CDL12_00905 [Handroanthus impetiginosus]